LDKTEKVPSEQENQARRNREKGENMMRKRVWIAALAVPAVIAVVLLFVGSPIVTANAPQAAVKTAEVKIDNFSFGPTTLTVAVGATVTWTNHDDIPHTVVSNDGVFKSKVLDTDEKFSYTFTKAGNYPYFCSIHPKMTGTIVVQ
jgi:plastocyanin